LWAGSRAGSVMPNRLNYYEIFVVDTQFTKWPRAAFCNPGGHMQPAGRGLETREG